VVSRTRWRTERAAVEHELAALGDTGWAVKPRAGGSSVGCSIVDTQAELADAFAAAFVWEEEALVESVVKGVEATGGVLEIPGRGPVALPVVEIRPHPGRFFDYQEKYTAAGALELCPPETLSPATCARIQELSLLAHRTLRCNGYSRSDFIVPPESEPVFLELNTLPGMTPRSLLPRAAEVAGIDYRTLCLLIAAEGVARSR
jgi:D-alanine-D-alanine ligase